MVRDVHQRYTSICRFDICWKIFLVMNFLSADLLETMLTPVFDSVLLITLFSKLLLEKMDYTRKILVGGQDIRTEILPKIMFDVSEIHEINYRKELRKMIDE